MLHDVFAQERGDRRTNPGDRCLLSLPLVRLYFSRRGVAPSSSFDHFWTPTNRASSYFGPACSDIPPLTMIRHASFAKSWRSTTSCFLSPLNRTPSWVP